MVCGRERGGEGRTDGSGVDLYGGEEVGEEALDVGALCDDGRGEGEAA
jgi:hypothetical protein